MDAAYQEALKRIEQAASIGSGELDLSELGLTRLPLEVLQLTNLQGLYLNHNQLVELPAEIVQLANLQQLNLNNNQLVELPAEIVQLTNLHWLDLRNNQLGEVPAEIGQLTNLQGLYLNHNQLVELPAEIGQLTNLQVLDLSNNQLGEVPAEIVQLTNLQVLDLSNNQLGEVPAEIVQLTNLQVLDLSNNQLREVPAEIGQLTNLQVLDLSNNQLGEVPAEIVQLTNLQVLDLSNNQLGEVPAEIVQLTNLQRLDLSNNQLGEVPAEIGQLTNLQWLYLSNNQLGEVPAEIVQLTNLQVLDLRNNQLGEVPAEIGQLTNLHWLDLRNNQLGEVPAEIGQLTNLQWLYLEYNQLGEVPAEIGQLTNLQWLYLEYNPLVFPSREILDLGMDATLTFLREVFETGEPVWRSKMLVVGQGGVGKTSLIRKLQGLPYDPKEDTTRGMTVWDVALPHPTKSDVNMTLSTWDFGGQQIYHATHQFFYSNRSLFLVTWNARLGYEQGKLSYWLDTIQALAPESPVLLVATFIDKHQPDLPLRDLMEQYPQVVGQVAISNETGVGIDELRSQVIQLASELPLMGKPWPKAWLEAADAIRDLDVIYTDPEQLRILAEEHHVKSDQAGILVDYMHSLGDILYFEDNPELTNVVILQPEWVSKRIGDVLTDKQVIARDGVFTRQDMAQVWNDLDHFLQDVLLRLMEQFDLSYIIPDDPR